MSLQAKRAPLDASYHFPVHSCGCPSCVSRLTPEHAPAWVDSLRFDPAREHLPVLRDLREAKSYIGPPPVAGQRTVDVDVRVRRPSGFKPTTPEPVS